MQGRLLAVAVAAATLAVPTLGAAAAGAATTPPVWQCRASALSASAAGNPAVEPVVAGGGAACADASTGLPAVPESLAIPATLLTTGALSAQTKLEPATGGAATQRVAAVGQVEGLALRLPPGAAATTLGVRSAVARVSGACVGGAPQLVAASEVLGVTLGGQEVPSNDVAARIAEALAPLGPIVDVKVGEEIRDGAGLTRRALHVRVLSAAGTPVLDVVAGEARVAQAGATCGDLGGSGGGGAGGGGGTGNGTGTGLQACPKGSELDAPSGFCVIRGGVLGTGASGGGGTAGKDIVVGRPFEGPSGGTVLSLEEARKRYKSRCLQGPGRNFAIVGTAKADRITGTNRTDRILTLAGDDRADGGRGNDCVDGGTGRDILSGALGVDHVIGGTGADSLNGGAGSDRLEGGIGNDTINAAYGRDRVVGGAGRDAINVATAGPAASVDCGSGRDKVRANGNERRRLKGCEVRYLLPDRRVKH